MLQFQNFRSFCQVEMYDILIGILEQYTEAVWVQFAIMKYS